MKIQWTGIAFVLVASVAWASPPGNQESLQVILEQQRALEADINDGGVEGLTKRQVNAIRKAQAEVFAVTEGKSHLDDLTIDQKVRLENALEQINAQYVGTRAAQEEQSVCWREHKSGTKMQITRCGTNAERDAAREGARAWMEKPKICAPPGCGS